ncbi:MAG: hypothetical protein U9Q69_03025 [Nanoarchaeota archaeon]|nr:hypothetical protein [Nanoarchaeota archaeon]
MDKRIKKALIMGIGLGEITLEKSQQIANKLLKKGEASDAQVKKLAIRMLKQVEKNEKRLKNRIKEEKKKAIAIALVESQKKLGELKSILHKLEAQTKSRKKPVKKKTVKKKTVKKKK